MVEGWRDRPRATTRGLPAYVAHGELRPRSSPSASAARSATCWSTGGLDVTYREPPRPAPDRPRRWCPRCAVALGRTGGPTGRDGPTPRAASAGRSARRAPAVRPAAHRAAPRRASCRRRRRSSRGPGPNPGRSAPSIASTTPRARNPHRRPSAAAIACSASGHRLVAVGRVGPGRAAEALARTRPANAASGQPGSGAERRRRPPVAGGTGSSAAASGTGRRTAALCAITSPRRALAGRERSTPTAARRLELLGDRAVRTGRPPAVDRHPAKPELDGELGRRRAPRPRRRGRRARSVASPDGR